MEQFKKNAAVIVLGVIAAAMLIGNICFVVFAKSSVKKATITKQEVKTVAGERMSDTKKIQTILRYLNQVTFLKKWKARQQQHRNRKQQRMHRMLPKIMVTIFSLTAIQES